MYSLRKTLPVLILLLAVGACSYEEKGTKPTESSNQETVDSTTTAPVSTYATNFEEAVKWLKSVASERSPGETSLQKSAALSQIQDSWIIWEGRVKDVAAIRLEAISVDLETLSGSGLAYASFHESHFDELISLNVGDVITVRCIFHGPTIGFRERPWLINCELVKED